MQVEREGEVMWRYVLIGWACCMFGVAQAASAPELEISQALRSTGVYIHVASVSEMIQRGLETRRQELAQDGVDVAAYGELAAVLDKVYSVAAIEQRMLKILVKGYDRNRIQMVNQGMASALATSMQALEDKARAQIGPHTGGGKVEKPTALRESLYASLDKASAESELTAGAHALAALALLDALALYKLEAAQLRDLGFDERLGLFYSQMLPKGQAEVLVLYHQAYKDTSDTALTQYARIYGNRATNWFISESIDALIASMRDIDIELSATLKRQSDQ